MDRAICLIDGAIKTVEELERLQGDELTTVRRRLICPECEGPAYFRKRTITGGAPCFGARHSPGCPLASNQQEIDEAYRDNGASIVIDFDFGTNDLDLGEDQEEDYIECERGNFEDESDEEKVSRRMSRLLNSLIYNESFRTCSREIIVEGYTRTVRDFFKKHEEVLNLDQRRRKFGVWGILSDANYKDETLWLNFGGTINDLSIPMESDKAEELKQRYGINDLEEFSGVGILVIGWVNKARESEKVFVKFENDIKYISIRKNV